MVKDVTGIKNARVTNKAAFKKTMRFVAATTAFNIFFEDILGIPSPFPTPIRATMKAIDEGQEWPSAMLTIGKEFIEPIPIIGSARYGKGPGGPGVELMNETVKHMTKHPFKEPAEELAGKWIGLPGTAQIAKTVKAKKRGESIYGQIVGQYTKKEKVSRSRRGSRTRRKRRGRR